MTLAFIILSSVAVAIMLCTAAAFTWLFHSLKWEVIEDAEFDFGGVRADATGWSRIVDRIWPRHRLLTYRRDSRGRFRRHRR